MTRMICNLETFDKMHSHLYTCISILRAFYIQQKLDHNPQIDGCCYYYFHSRNLYLKARYYYRDVDYHTTIQQILKDRFHLVLGNIRQYQSFCKFVFLVSKRLFRVMSSKRELYVADRNNILLRNLEHLFSWCQRLDLEVKYLDLQGIFQNFYTDKRYSLFAKRISLLDLSLLTFLLYK